MKEYTTTKSNQVLFDEVSSVLYREMIADKVNQDITEILKDNFYVGFDNETGLSFIQYKTSLFIINTKILLQEIILIKLLTKEFTIFKLDIECEPTNNINDINEISSDNHRDLENYIKLVEFINSEQELIKHGNNKSMNSINDSNSKEIINSSEVANLFDKINNYGNVVGTLGIQLFYNLVKLPFVQLCSRSGCILFNDNDSNIEEFSNYFPQIFYSILTFFKYRYEEKKQLNMVFEIYKIMAYYIAEFYYNKLIEKEDCNDITNDNDEYVDSFLRNNIFQELKTKSPLVIRNNIKESSFIQKIVDTDSLYTVFERC